MRPKIPPQVNYILETLTDAGHEAYAVGGCVRDSLLGREPDDWDITTSALPQEVKSLFRRTADTGIRHGTVTVLIKDRGFEVTTFRIDGAYTDGRRPDSVTFTPNLEDDLLRRDFTINAMAYHPQKGLCDPYGGMDDLNSRTIRAVGDPDKRFGEDALRILRAVRFAAQLSFRIEPETLSAISRFAPKLSGISRERIRTELTKLLISENPGMFRLLYKTGITAVILPVFDSMMALPQNNPCHFCTVGEHTVITVENTPPDPVLRWTALLHDTGKTVTHSVDSHGMDHYYGHGAESAKIALNVLRGLKFDNRSIRSICTLVAYHDFPFTMSKRNLREAVYRVGRDLFPSLLTIMRADNMAKNDYAKMQLLPALERISQMYDEIIRDGDCVTVGQLAVNGNDLIAAGIRPGPAIGKLLDQMIWCVMEDPARNNYEYLMSNFVK